MIPLKDNIPSRTTPVVNYVLIGAFTLIVGIFGVLFALWAAKYSSQQDWIGYRVIFDELCLGVVKPDSKAEYLRVIAELAARGAQGILLGCTELGLIVSAADVALPLFDTTVIHAKKALELSLA